MKKIIKPTADLIFKHIDIPVVEFTLSNGVKGRGLIDTGSESTMLDIAFLKANKKCFAIKNTNEKMNFIGFYGSEDRNLIKASTYIHFGTYATSLDNVTLASLDGINKSIEEMYGKDIHIDIVLGGDFFLQKNIEINYNNKTLIFNN